MTDFFQKYRTPLAVLLAAVLLFTLSGCGYLYPAGDLSDILDATDPKNEQTPTDDEDRMFSLSYYTGEALNPFTSVSRTNSQLLRLCYSGLFAVDAAYNALPVLAQSYSVDGNTVTVTLRSDVRFSDGSPVTAYDCEASYDRANYGSSVWESAFSYITSYYAVDGSTFELQFRSYSPTQLNLLTIPVVRADTVEDAAPVGCGRYVLSADGTALLPSSCGCYDGKYAIDRIALLGIADKETLTYNFNYGRLQAICADLSMGAGEYRSDCELVTVPTNRLTFIVVNRKNAALASVDFAKGITYLMDRTQLASQVYGSFASPVWSPLNPAWSKTEEAVLNPDIYSVTTANQYFNQAGWTLNGSARVYKGKSMPLRILVNLENNNRIEAAHFVAQTLRSAGFTVEVVTLAWDEYTAAIQAQEFDLYLGEVEFHDNMDLSSLLSQSVCHTGDSTSYSSLRSSAAGLLRGTVEARTFVSEFQNVLPCIPLCYACDALAVSMDVVGTFGGSVSELYYGLESWELRSRSDPS